MNLRYIWEDKPQEGSLNPEEDPEIFDTRLNEEAFDDEEYRACLGMIYDEVLIKRTREICKKKNRNSFLLKMRSQ